MRNCYYSEGYGDGFEDGIEEGEKRALEKLPDVPSYLSNEDCEKIIRELISRISYMPYYRYKLQEIFKEAGL